MKWRWLRAIITRADCWDAPSQKYYIRWYINIREPGGFCVQVPDLEGFDRYEDAVSYCQAMDWTHCRR